MININSITIFFAFQLGLLGTLLIKNKNKDISGSSHFLQNIVKVIIYIVIIIITIVIGSTRNGWLGTPDGWLGTLKFPTFIGYAVTRLRRYAYCIV